MGDGYAKYVVGALVLIGVVFAGLHFAGVAKIPFLSGRGEPVVEADDSPAPEPPPEPLKLVWSWRYRVTAEQDLPGKQEPETRETTGPWVSMVVVAGETATGRVELADGSFLVLSGEPQYQNIMGGFNKFKYRWEGLERSFWLSEHAKYFPAREQATVSGSQSSWGYQLKNAIPVPREMAAPAPEKTPEEKPKAAPADGTETKTAAPAQGETATTDPQPQEPTVKPKPKSPAKAPGEGETMHAIGSWSNAADGYKGTITLWLEMQLSPQAPVIE